MSHSLHNVFLKFIHNRTGSYVLTYLYFSPKKDQSEIEMNESGREEKEK